MYNPIYNKAIGRITSRDGKAVVSFRAYKGLTDIFSLIFLFIGTFIIISLSCINFNVNIVQKVSLSFLCCILASVTTYAFTYLSEQGKQNETKLINFIKRSLKLD